MRWLAAPTLTAAALLPLACGDDTSDAVTIEVTAPNRGEVLTLEEDDADPDLAGLQFEVRATTTGISRGTTLHVFIDGERRADSGRVDLQGDTTVEGVTLPPGRHTLYLATTTGSAASDPNHEYNFRGIEITSPESGSTLTSADDRDPLDAGVQIDVMVASFGVDVDEEVVLLLDDHAAARAMPDELGDLVFSGVGVSNGAHTLQAQVGEGDDALLSAEIEIDVRDSCPSIAFIDPRPPGDGEGAITLGGAGQCPSGSDPFTTDVSIATNAEDGVPVQLLVNGQQVGDGVVTGSLVTFEDVALGLRTSENRLEVEIDTPEGVDCNTSFPVGILVDCAGVDCTIASPMPVEFTDDAGASTLYLNAALRGEGGFEVAVESNDEIAGRDVELVIDGNTRHARRAPAEADGALSIARFGDLDLNDGPHTFEAFCTDAQGNVTSSGEFSWTVDVTPCEVDLTDPAPGAVFVPADDEDAASSGTQIVTSATVGGDDCVSQRADTCDVAVGIEGPDFAAFDGGSLLSTVTLDDAPSAQTLCLEVADRAGNVGLDSVAVEYRGSAPLVLVESPADGARYNALGGGGYLADADPGASPTACDAAFSIACSELGVDVELFRDGDAAPFASAECQEPSAIDPALPAGYPGRARMTVLFDDGDGSATLVARQKVAGSSGEELVGSSAAVALQGDCWRPAVSFTGDPCAVLAGGQLSAVQAAARDFGVADTTADTATFALAVANTDGTTAMPDPTSTTPASAPFSAASWVDVDLGGAGAVTITATAHDDFDNSMQVMCTATVLADLPVITSFTAPADGAVFGPGNGCDTGVVGEFGVLVQATADREAERQVTVLVNGVAEISDAPPGTGGSIDVCVPVPDNVTNAGSSTVTLRVTSTLGPGVAEQSRDVDVVLALPSDATGIVIEPLLPPALADADHRDGSLATWVLNEDYAGQLRSYELRCDDAELLESASDDAKRAWWEAVTADAVDLGGLTPADDPEIRIVLRPEEPRHCVLRARDPAGEYTPIVHSTELTLRLRQTVIATGTAGTGLGAKVAAAGDVDRDGVDDLLVAGFGRTELIFGAEGDPTSAPRVVFTSFVSVVSTAVSGVGDFNGDGYDDFVIGNAVANSNAGRVSIFFGRPREQWPATLDIETTCNADLCIDGATNSQLGRALAALGEFNDNDDRPDFALGSSPANQVFVVLGDDYEVRSCTACLTGESCFDDVCMRDVAPGAGAPSFWKLRFSMPTGDSTDPATSADLQGFALTSSGLFGVSIAAMGDFDTMPGNDLAIGAALAQEVHFLSGRDYTGSGVQPLMLTDLGLPDVTTGVPDGMPISDRPDLSGYGFVIANVGDFYQAAGATEAAVDLGVARSNQNEIYLVPGDPLSATDSGFSAASVRVSASGQIGQSIGTSLHAVHGLLGDIDGDGEPELCTGTRLAPNDILFWYPDRFAAAIVSGTVDRASAFSIVTATTGTAQLTTQYVGDINGDGHLDIAVGDLQANMSQGRLVLLY